MPTRNYSLILSLMTLVFVILLVGCADKKATAPPDFSPPSRVVNLIAGNATDSSITLQWTSPGDNADTGMAYLYDLRYSLFPITDFTWESASAALGLPLPQLAGYLEEFTVTGLAGSTRYFFALKTADEVPQWSPLSNISTERTVGTGSNHWSPLDTGLNGPAEALTIYDNKLIVGGMFMAAGEIMANRVAAWDDSSWSSLGQGIGGMNANVLALAVYNVQLIAAGRFGGPNGNILAWDGSSWNPLGSGFNNFIGCLAVYNNRLIAGGDFTAIGGMTANHIAAWDGSSWAPLGDGVDGYVGALFVSNNQLIVGGSFDMAGDSSAHHIASWDGAIWRPLDSGIGGGMNPEVSALTEFNGQLIVAGFFSMAGQAPVGNIAAWDGISWSALSAGTNTAISALIVYDNMLIAGGAFTSAGDIPVNRIAAWDGGGWSQLDTGLDGDVYCMAVYNNKLIVAGNFVNAGELMVHHIAAWSQSLR